MKCPYCEDNAGFNLQKIECNPIMVKDSVNKLEEMYAVCCGTCDKIIVVLPKSSINK